MNDSSEAIGAGQEKTVTAPKKTRGIIFIIVSALAFLVIPFMTAVSIVLMVILSPAFYTGILKNGRFITAFVEAKNWQIDRTINDEIENSLDLRRFTAEFEKIKARYEQAKDTYMKISRDGEVESLKRERSITRSIEWKQVRGLFPSEDEFEKQREKEVKRLEKAISLIEDYQEKNSDAIKMVKKEMKNSRSEYEDSLSILEQKKSEADKIIEKHKNTLASSIYEDLEIIERPLAKIVNDRLIDGAVSEEIEKMLRFFTDYNAQVERGNIFYERAIDPATLGRRVLNVRLPEIEINLWVDDAGHGKRHVLSHLLVEEIDRIHKLRNKTLLLTMFRLSDSSLGEYFGGRYLSSLGLSLDGGVIRRPATLLRDTAAEHIARIMEILTWGQYLYLVAAGLLVLYIAFLFFSTVERRRKLKALKRLFIYPSLLVLTVCGLLLLASQTVFRFYPDIIQNLTVRSYAKHMSFIAAGYIVFPLVVVFGAAFVAGLVMRKILARNAHKKDQG
jgi:hypothetical protein